MKPHLLTGLIASGLIVAGCSPDNTANEPDMSIVHDNGSGSASVTRAPSTEEGGAMKAYAEANRKMHEGMAAIDPDPDIAFMQGMVPHHQGAVDMAEIVLKYGKDPEARALAETIIESQTREIAQMSAWLKKRGVEPAKPSKVDHGAMGH